MYVASMASNEPENALKGCPPHGEDFGQHVPEFAVVVPTLNEADNIEPLLAKVETALQGVRWEIIFVDDDSQDCTREVILRRCRCDPRVRLVHRVGRRGLSSAVVEGILSTSASSVRVID